MRQVRSWSTVPGHPQSRQAMQQQILIGRTVRGALSLVAGNMHAIAAAPVKSGDYQFVDFRSDRTFMLESTANYCAAAISNPCHRQIRNSTAQ